MFPCENELRCCHWSNATSLLDRLDVPPGEEVTAYGRRGAEERCSAESPIPSCICRRCWLAGCDRGARSESTTACRGTGVFGVCGTCSGTASGNDWRCRVSASSTSFLLTELKVRGAVSPSDSRLDFSCAILRSQMSWFVSSSVIAQDTLGMTCVMSEKSGCPKRPIKPF